MGIIQYPNIYPRAATNDTLNHEKMGKNNLITRDSEQTNLLLRYVLPLFYRLQLKISHKNFLLLNAAECSA